MKETSAPCDKEMGEDAISAVNPGLMRIVAGPALAAEPGFRWRVQAGAEYIVHAVHVADIEAQGRAPGGKWIERAEELPYATTLSPTWSGEVRRKPWDGMPLGGRSLLFIPAGGIGDHLFLTAVMAEVHKRYPTADLAVMCLEERSAPFANLAYVRTTPYPMDARAFMSFDFHFDAHGLLLQFAIPDQPNCYDALFEAAGIADAPIEARVPQIVVTAEEEEAFAVHFTAVFLPALFQKGRLARPDGAVVVQIHTSQASRDPDAREIVGLIPRLTRDFPNAPIVMVGGGAIESQATRAMQVFTDAFARVEERDRGRLIPMIEGGAIGGRPTTFALGELFALVKRAKLVIAPDSAFVHIAAAFSVPTIALYGPFDPRWRLATYPRAVSIYEPSSCPMAPCAYHGKLSGTMPEFPSGCPAVKDESAGIPPSEKDNPPVCCVMRAATAERIAGLARLMAGDATQRIAML